MHFLWNFAFKFLGFVHNWKQKYNQNTVRRTEIKDFGVWWEAGNTKNLAAESVLQRLPGQGGLESYISNQTAGCFTSQTEQPAFLSFTILHTSLYSFPFCSKQPFHISRKGKKKNHSFNTELMKQAPQWDSLLLAVVQMMYFQGRSSKQQQASAGALL